MSWYKKATWNRQKVNDRSNPSKSINKARITVAKKKKRKKREKLPPVENITWINWLGAFY